EGRRLKTDKGELKTAAGEGTFSGPVMEGDGAAEGVRVGDVLVWLGRQKVKEGNTGTSEKGTKENENIGQVA
ncbi:hypothetical protein A2U01_0108208, partial [Trifolium medium]|nr:hypothetical protein [Trifolium medium]